jgi:hypothetical protein
MGYVHLKNVLSDEFRAHLAEFSERSLRECANEIGDWKIHGKKRQFLFDFASREDADRFRTGMAALIGIDPETFTISERHLKVYDDEAPCWPSPHKDRAASEISIGLPVHIPAGSSACMFPELNFGANAEERAVFLTERNNHPDPEGVYRTEDAVMLNEQFGDVIAFLGSSIFHERVRPAGAAILYIKVNGSGRDPLGEDIFADELA